MSTWRPIRAFDRARFAAARLQAHHATQWLARTARAYVPARPDDGHTSLGWDDAFGGFVSHPLPDGARLGLRFADLSLALIESDATSPHGHVSPRRPLRSRCVRLADGPCRHAQPRPRRARRPAALHADGAAGRRHLRGGCRAARPARNLVLQRQRRRSARCAARSPRASSTRRRCAAGRIISISTRWSRSRPAAPPASASSRATTITTSRIST